jgi:hypothetical protein
VKIKAETCQAMNDPDVTNVVPDASIRHSSSQLTAPTAHHEPKPILAILFPITLYIIGACEFFRWQISSNFDILIGDRGDARFVTFIHEHVYRSLTGHSPLLTPPFFFNQTQTLGYSDAFLLNQVIYAPLRLAGADPMLAVSLTAIILSAFAFLFFFLFLRKLGLTVAMASLASFIFTFPNNLYIKSGHLQHFAVYYIPVILYFGSVAIAGVHRRPIRACMLAAIAAGLYGLLFSTGYYMAWFCGLGLLIFIPIVAYTAWPQLRFWWKRGPARIRALGVAAIGGFFATLWIFAVIYVPVLSTGAHFDFNVYLSFAPTPIDIVNVGSENLVWSRLIRALHLIRDNRLGFIEVSIALTPTVQLLLLSSAILAFRSGFWPDDDTGRIRRALVLASAGVCLLLYLLTIKTHNLSLFRVLYAILPGASAIRVGYRCMIVANVFAAMAIGLTFDRVIKFAFSEHREWWRVGAVAAAACVLLLAGVEQINLARNSLFSRTFEREHLAAVRPAPRECRSFYAAPQANRDPYEVQIDAMMVALGQLRPTINGYSGLFPRGWDLYDTKSASYEEEATRWAIKRDITEGLCRLNVIEGTWAVLRGDPSLLCEAGDCTSHPSRGNR